MQGVDLLKTCPFYVGRVICQIMLESSFKLVSSANTGVFYALFVGFNAASVGFSFLNIRICSGLSFSG